LREVASDDDRGAAASGRPWENDVKGLAASLAVAGRESGLGAKDCAAAVRRIFERCDSPLIVPIEELAAAVNAGSVAAEAGL
jgi:hypothetical protein